MMTNYKTIYTIVDTETNEFVSINNKAAWTKVGNAKNAWNMAHRWMPGPLYFSEQTRYVIKAIECKEQQ